MEKFLSSILVGLILTIPLGSGAFTVIRAVIARDLFRGVAIASACVLVDIWWVNVALYFSIGLTFNTFFFIVIGIILFAIGISIWYNGDKEEHVGFGKVFVRLIPNVTVVLSTTFLLTLCVGAECFTFPWRIKFLLAIGIVLGEISGWTAIIISTNFISKHRRISVPFVATVYGLIISLLGILTIIKQFI